jgi:hypothetical protein
MESNESQVGRDAAVTRYLLGCGVAVGPFYLAVGLIQARVREASISHATHSACSRMDRAVGSRLPLLC